MNSKELGLPDAPSGYYWRIDDWYKYPAIKADHMFGVGLVKKRGIIFDTIVDYTGINYERFTMLTADEQLVRLRGYAQELLDAHKKNNDIDKYKGEYRG